eukprot:sb/3479297/
MSLKQDVDVLVFQLSKAVDDQIPNLLIQIEELLQQYDRRDVAVKLWNMVIEAGGDVIKVSVVPCGLAGDVRGFSLTQRILVITFRRKCHLQNTQ